MGFFIFYLMFSDSDWDSTLRSQWHVKMGKVSVYSVAVDLAFFSVARLENFRSRENQLHEYGVKKVFNHTSRNYSFLFSSPYSICCQIKVTF